MATFAERLGRRSPRTLVQSDSLDAETRVQLWNVMNTLRKALQDASHSVSDTRSEKVLAALWAWRLKKPADEQPRADAIWGIVKDTIINGDWVDALEVIEGIVKDTIRFETAQNKDLGVAVVEAFNNRFEHFLVGFRFIGGEIAPIHSTMEAEAVSDAQADTQTLAGARHSLDQALEHLADRQNPDYPNSIKESISAVEAVIRKVTGEKSLGAGLGKLEKAGLVLHPALKSAWSKMYGWTSDGSGIRHGDINAADADQALAKYMLVTCSGFISYLVEQGRKTELL